MSKARKEALVSGFVEAFGAEPVRFFSSPGRTEIGGNHTDHQRGRVLAAAIECDTVAAVRETGTEFVRVFSRGYPLCEVRLSETSVVAGEENTTCALVRGVLSRFQALGYALSGFDAYCCSDVLPGSGMSSSASFEVLLAAIVNALFCRGELSPAALAEVGRYAENVYFGKPCGLMDRMACAVGSLVCLDFAEGDCTVRAIDVDPERFGYGLCILDTRADHADLTDEYAAIPREMEEIARSLSVRVLSEAEEGEFYRRLPSLRAEHSDRALLRAMHFFQENRRVLQMAEALDSSDFERFLALVSESGRSSRLCLQNITPTGQIDRQPVAFALALCETLLAGRGTVRVHGGGFAGTVQAYVPLSDLKRFSRGYEAVMGEGTCRRVKIRRAGAGEILC